MGKYDMPLLYPVYELPEIKEWIGFNYVLSDKNPEGKAVHFFIDDYQFERIFNQPERYVDKLKQYVAVATPDFSPYGDMPLIAQMWNHYRKQWVGAWLQRYWLKFNKSGKVTIEGKISKKDIKRARNLLKKS